MVRARLARCRLAVKPAEEVRLAVEIVPRWEWRTFGNDFGAAEEALGALEVERFEESADLYLLFRDGDATVKVRHGLLDVKGLLTVDDDGLEQWVPVAKHPFPVSRDDVAAALARLQVVAPPPLDRETYTAEELLDEVVRPVDALRAVMAHKRRTHYVVDGCMAEICEIRTDERLHALARARVRGSRAGDGGRSLPRPHRARERVHGPRAEGADRLRDGALRRDRRRHELGQAPRRRAPRRRHVERGHRPRDRHPARRGPRRDRRPRARADGPDAGGDRGAGRARRARPARPRSPPSAPQGCAPRRTPPSSSAPPSLAAASGSRSSPARRRARLAYLAATSGLGLGARLARGLRHRRRQLPVHLRRRRTRSRSSSACRSARSA